MNFKFDHIDIQAATAGSIADAKDWMFSDIKLIITDGSNIKVSDSTGITGLPTATGAPPSTAGN